MMMRSIATTVALVLLTAAGCGSNKKAPDEQHPLEAFLSGSTRATATTHWESSGTSSIALKIALYGDEDADILVSGSLYDSVNFNRGASYEGTWEFTGEDSIDVTLEGEDGEVTLEITDMSYNDETETWDIIVYYDGIAGDEPQDYVMSVIECEIATANPEGTGCL